MNKFFLFILILNFYSCSILEKKKDSDYKPITYLVKVQDDYNDRNLYIDHIIEESKNKNYLLGLEQYINPSKLNKNTINLQDQFDKDLSVIWYSFIVFNASLKDLINGENLMPHDQIILKNRLDEAKISYIVSILNNEKIFKEIEKINFLRNKKMILFQEAVKSFYHLNMKDKAPTMVYRSVIWHDHFLFLEHSYLVLKELMNSELEEMIPFQNRISEQFLSDPNNELKIETFVNDIFTEWRKDSLFYSVDKIIKKSKKEKKEILLLINKTFYDQLKEYLLKKERKKMIELKFHQKK